MDPPCPHCDSSSFLARLLTLLDTSPTNASKTSSLVVERRCHVIRHEKGSAVQGSQLMDDSAESLRT
jgi:hypothetical protein